MLFTYEIQKNKYYDIKLVLLGFLLWSIRLFSIQALKVGPKTLESYPGLPNHGIWTTFIDIQAWYHPDILHTSFFVALFCVLCLIFSFRSKILNAIPVILLPSVIVTLPVREFVIWFNPHYTAYYRLNYITMHIPVLILGIYILMMRRVYLSIPAAWIGGIMSATWFLLADNKDNGVLDGIYYVLVVLGAAIIWGVFLAKVMLKNPDPQSPDPLFAPMIKITGFAFKKHKS